MEAADAMTKGPKQLLFSTLLLAATMGWAKAGSNPARPIECAVQDLRQKDCLLRLKNLKVRLSAQKILIDNGTWKTLRDLPLVGEGTEWQRVRLMELHRRPLIDLLIWEAPAGPLQFQKLQWFVFEIREAAAELKLKRAVKARSAGDVKVEDQPPKFGLKSITPAPSIEWYQEHDKGVF